MRNARTVDTFGRKNIAVLAAIAVSSLAATPFVMSASRALATSEDQPVAATLRVEPVDVAPVAAAPKADGDLPAQGAGGLQRIRPAGGRLRGALRPAIRLSPGPAPCRPAA